MKYRIHYTLPSGDEDSIDIEGETIEDIREKARIEIDKRGAVGNWSEEI